MYDTSTSSSVTTFIELPVMRLPNTIMTFDQYMQRNETNVSDNWGWFIDIEPKKNNFINYSGNNCNIYKYKYHEKLKKHLPIPETIFELKSVKSVNKLMYDSESLLFTLEDNDNDKNKNKDYKNKRKDNNESNEEQLKMGCFIIITCLVIFTFV